VKAKFRRLIKNAWPRSVYAQSPEVIERRAAKLAAHHCCSCFICKRPRYVRERFDAREEA
jgi:hypothetical protein